MNKRMGETALIVCALMDGLVTMMFGPKCKMTPDEQEMIAQPLQRMLQRMDFGAQEQVDKWADPIMFVFGLIAWGSRIARIEREEVSRRAAQQREAAIRANAGEPIPAPVPEPQAPAPAKASPRKAPVATPPGDIGTLTHGQPEVRNALRGSDLQ